MFFFDFEHCPVLLGSPRKAGESPGKDGREKTRTYKFVPEARLDRWIHKVQFMKTKNEALNRHP